MTTKPSADLATVSDITPTPYIASSANYFGTGASAKAARQALVKAGGSSDEEQTIFKLPEGAVGAYVSSKGDIHWGGVEGEAQPVYRYVAGKSVALGDAKPVAYKRPTAKTAPRHSPRAQDLGEIFPEPKLDAVPPTDDKSSTISAITPDAPAGKPKRVRVKPDQLLKFVVGDKAQWTSGPMSNRVTHVGDVTHVIPAGGLPEAGLLRGTDGRDTGRNVESYIVREGNRNYWPHTSALTRPESQPSVEVTQPADPVQAAVAQAEADGSDGYMAGIAAKGELDKALKPGEGNTLAAWADIIMNDGKGAKQETSGPQPATEVQPVQEDAAPVKPATKPSKKGKKLEQPTEPVTMAPIAEMVERDIARDKAAAKPVKAKADPKAPKASKPATEAKPIEAADFLLMVGGSFYDKDSFIKECDTLGISRRMPSHRLPKGLVAGQSRVYVASEGVRKTEGVPMCEVFGYFTPERVEFICTSEESEEAYADIIAAVQARGAIKIIKNISGEAVRECGVRQEGGTYIVVDKGISPLKLLDKPASYVGNHFRGMLKLSDVQVRTFNTGGTVETIMDEVCMGCGAAMKCAPDGHIRAERERKRIDKGLEPKWRLNCAKCQAQVRADRKAAAAVDGAATSATEAEGDSVEVDDGSICEVCHGDDTHTESCTFAHPEDGAGEDETPVE